MVSVGIIRFLRGIEVDAAGTAGYSTILENVLLFGGATLLVMSVIAVVVLALPKRRIGELGHTAR